MLPSNVGQAQSEADLARHVPTFKARKVTTIDANILAVYVWVIVEEREANLCVLWQNENL